MAEDCGCDGSEEFANLADVPDDESPDLHPDPRGNTVRRFNGLVAPYNLPTGDGRRFASGALGNRELPMPLKWQRTDNSGHSTSVVVGRIDGLDYKDDGVYAWGIIFDPTKEDMPQLAEDCNEVWHLLSNKVIGPSVDLDDMQFHQLSDPSELAAGARPEIEVTKGRISAATLVPIPAFAEARPFTLDTPDADEYADMTAVTASGVVQGLQELPVAHDEEWDLVQWLLAPEPSTALYSGEHGDLFPVAREVDGQLSLVPAAVADAISVFTTHQDALQLDEGAKSALRDQLEALAQTCGMDSPPWVQDRALVAAGAPVRSVKPLAAFQDPRLDRPTPIQLERMDDGTVRVYGHVADWKTCHIGFQDRCVTAPRSKSAYAHFHKGSVLTENGVLPTGKITIGGGHADTSLSFAAAAQHYDDVSSCVADVRAGEDKHGIWVAGVVRPGTDQNRLDELASSPLSGDWRRIGGHLEMIAALAVNTPGFPLPEVAEDRTGALALVAAGVVMREPDGDEDPVTVKGKKKRKPMSDDDGDEHDYRYSVDAGAVADMVYARMQADERSRREAAMLADAFAVTPVQPESAALAAILEDTSDVLDNLDNAQLAQVF
jgi:hypothetical protein